MNPSVGHWIAPTYSSVYHGRADATDGSVWVIPRCHTIAGPYVVVHRGAPDGVVIRRIAVTHAAEAILLVDRLRSLILRTRVSGIAGTLAPLLPRGSCILHGVGAGSLDASPATYLCAEFWALPGTHQVLAARLPQHYELERVTEVARTTFGIQFRANETVHLRFRWGWGNRITLGRPMLHACKIRNALDSSESVTAHATIDEP